MSRGVIDQILAKFADDHKYDCDWTDLPLNSNAKVYSTDQKPKYRRYGKVVQMFGAVSPKSQVAAGTNFDFATLPVNYRPAAGSVQSIICQGSGNNTWQLVVGSTGVVSCQRHRSGTSNAAIATSAWLIFSLTFIVA